MKSLFKKNLLKHYCWKATVFTLVLGSMIKFYSGFVFADSIVLNDRQINEIVRQYGSSAGNRLKDWRKLIIQNENKNISEKLELVNQFFNQLEFISDQEHWNEKDYWATPVEFLATRGGDCEDFAIAKYFTLRELGVPVERMRITYVKALTLNQAHMVLAYYETPDAEPLLLDNIDTDVKLASRRKDLIPVYSFNGDSLWIAKQLNGRGRLVGKSQRIGLWRKLLSKIQKEQSIKH